MDLRTAVVGVGHLGRQHARIHRTLADEGLCRFVGVCDVNEETARSVAEERAVEWTTDWRTLLEATRTAKEDGAAISKGNHATRRVDAVSLAVPTEVHCEIACAFLEAGVHVLVEKPIARSVAEADSMIEAARRGRALLQVGHLERFNPALVALHPEVKNPLYFEIHRVGQFTARSLDIDVVLDLMIHDLDIVQWLVGYDTATTDVRAVGIPVLTNRVDAANARIEFASGAVANITASRVGTEKIRKMRFFQPHDYIAVDYGTRVASISTLALPTLANLDPASLKRLAAFAIAASSQAETNAANFSPVSVRYPATIDIEPLRAETEAFLLAIKRGDDDSPVPGWQGRRALELAQDVLTRIHLHAERTGIEAFDQSSDVPRPQNIQFLK